MTFAMLLIVVVVAGIALYILNNHVEIVDAKMKKLINVLVTSVVAIIVLVWLFGFLGVDVGLPRGRFVR